MQGREAPAGETVKVAARVRTRCAVEELGDVSGGVQAGRGDARVLLDLGGGGGGRSGVSFPAVGAGQQGGQDDDDQDAHQHAGSQGQLPLPG